MSYAWYITLWGCTSFPLAGPQNMRHDGAGSRLVSLQPDIWLPAVLLPPPETTIFSLSQSNLRSPGVSKLTKLVRARNAVLDVVS